MKWEVAGVRKSDGQDVKMVVDALNQMAAEDIAAKQGVMVERVVTPPLPVKPAAAKPPRIPAPAALTDDDIVAPAVVASAPSYLLLQIIAIALLSVGAFVLLLGAMNVVAAKTVEPSGYNSSDLAALAARQDAYYAGGEYDAIVGFAAVAAGAALLALRDIAANSWR